MTLIRRAIPFILAALVTAPALAGPRIELADPWARPTIPNRPGAAYLEIRNAGDAPDRLVGAHAEGVGAVELHKAEQKDGMMTMAPVEAIEVPAGGAALLAPGGYHLMLFDIAAPLREGDTLDLTLRFEQAGEIAVAVPVMQREGMGGGTDSGMQHGSGHGSPAN
jgi:hypothetical protein